MDLEGSKINQDSQNSQRSDISTLFTIQKILQCEKSISKPIKRFPFQDLSIDYCEIQGQQVNQIACIEQEKPDLCGFHTIFNLFVLLSEIKSPDIKEIKKQIMSEDNFWNSYKFYYDYLQKNFPNKNDLKYLENYGPLERSHMEFLFDSSQIKTILKSYYKEEFEIEFSTFYYGYGVIQSCEEDLHFLEKISTQLQKNKKNSIVLVALGVTIHWSLLVIEKIEGTLRFYYLDSKNISIQDIVQQNVDKLIQKWNEKKEKETTISCTLEETQQEKNRQKQWIKDMNRALDILIDVFKNQVNFESIVIKEQLRTIVEDLQAYISPFQNNPNQQVEQIYKWFEEEYRPQVLVNDLVKPLTKAKLILNADQTIKLKSLSEFTQLALNNKNILSKNKDFDLQLYQAIQNFHNNLKDILNH